MKASVMSVLVLCLVATASASETYDVGTKTLTVTADSLAAQIDPLGEVQDFQAATYAVPAMSKVDFNALPGLKTVTFNGAPDARQGTTKIVAYYDASNYVTFSGFGNANGYNYGGGTSSGRRAHSGTADWQQLGLVGGDAASGPFHPDASTPGLEGLNWLKMSIAVNEPGKGVTAIGFIVDGRDDQNTQDGSIWVMLSDSTEVKLDYKTFGGVANSGLFFGYQAPAGTFITGIEATRKDSSGNSFLALDDLTFQVGGETPNTAPVISSIVPTPVTGTGAMANTFYLQPAPATNDLTLTASVTDDGQIAPLTYAWSVASATPAPFGTALAQVSFESAAAATTRVRFSRNGTYVLQLAAFDGQFTTTSTVTIRVTSCDVDASFGTVNAGDRTKFVAAYLNTTNPWCDFDGSGGNVNAGDRTKFVAAYLKSAVQTAYPADPFH
jgi:hypothetical protein